MVLKYFCKEKLLRGDSDYPRIGAELILSLYLPVFKLMSWFPKHLPKMNKKVWLVGFSYHYELMDFITSLLSCWCSDCPIFSHLEPFQVDAWLLAWHWLPVVNFLTFWSDQMFQVHLVCLLLQTWNRPFLQEVLVPYIPPKDFDLSSCIPENCHFPGQ